MWADVEADTGNVDVASIAPKISARTRAIVAVHYAGYPCDLDALYALARDHGLAVVEDCAHACGAVYRGARVGSHGDLHAFSFHAVKNLSMGDGGALVVRGEAHAARLRRLRWLGIDKDTFRRAQGGRYRWDYDVSEVGFKYHMNDLEAAIGLVQLGRLEAENARRAEIVARYRRGLAEVPGVRLLRRDPDRVSADHLACILAEDRDGLVAKLGASGIETGVHYRRNDGYPMYRRDDGLVNAERFWRAAVSLPLHLQLTDEDVDYVIDRIRSGW